MKLLVGVCLALLTLPIVTARQVPAGGSPQQPAVLEGTSALSGVVTDGTTKQPLGGVMVYLGFQGRGAVGRLSRQISDERGRFVFTDLPAGNSFFINATKPGYLDGHYGVGAGGLSGGLITLAEGQWFSDANVAMQRPGSISGTITDEHGEPAVGVFVRAFSRIFVAGHIRLAAGQIARTDDRGVYRLADLVPGKYMVQVPLVRQTISATMSAAEIAGITPEQAATGRPVPEPPPSVDLGNGTRLIVGGYRPPPAPVNGRPQAYLSLFHPGAVSIDSATSIDLHAGAEVKGIDISLRAAPATGVAGVIEGPGDAIANLTVRLLAEGLEDAGSAGELATTMSDADGRFAFTGIPAGAYVIDVRRTVADLTLRVPLGTQPAQLPTAPGTNASGSGGILSGPYGATYSIRDSRRGGEYFAQQKVAAGAMPVSDLRIPLRRGVSIRGRFVHETGAVPVRGIGSGLIYAEPANGNLGAGFATSVQPAPSPTTFEIHGIPPGQFTLRFLTLPVAGTVKSVVADDGVDYRVRPFDATSGRDFDVVVTVTDKSIDLSGIAVDAKGAQVTNAVVIAFPVERDQWTNYGLNAVRLRGSPTTSSGTYRFQSLPAGDYYLIGVPPDQSNVWQDPAKLAVMAPLATRVTLAWGDVTKQNVTVVRIR